MKYQVEFDDHGWYRITSSEGAAGEPVPFSSIALLREGGRVFIAFSDYWATEGGPETERVFELKEV